MRLSYFCKRSCIIKEGVCRTSQRQKDRKLNTSCLLNYTWLMVYWSFDRDVCLLNCNGGTRWAYRTRPRGRQILVFILFISACFILIYLAQAIRIFLSEVNEERSKCGQSPVGTATAVKFLMARKFDVSRALVLYRAHQVSLSFWI